MQHILAFFDEDKIYGDRFKKFAASHSNCPFTVYSFHDYKALKNFSLDHPIELLVGSETNKPKGDTAVTEKNHSYDSDESKYDNCNEEKLSEIDPLYTIEAKSIISLSESPINPDIQISDSSLHGEKGLCKHQIYKYQSGESILREIMTIYGKKEPVVKKENSASLSKLYLVYSPIGRSGKTTFARSLTKTLKKDCTTLYITLEEVSDTSDTHCDAFYHDTLSEAFYFYKEGKLTDTRFKDLIYHSDEYDHILPVRTPEDLTTLDPGELTEFIEHIRRISGTDAIIIDTDSILSRIEGLFPRADKIFMPVTEDYSANNKLQLLEIHLSKTQPPEVLSQIVKLLIPDSRDFPSCDEASSGDSIKNYTSAVIQNYIYK